MIVVENKWSVRSAGELLADLAACRQLRHLTDAHRRSVVRYFFGNIQNPLKENKRLKTGRYFVWTYEGFETAFSTFGASCDCCGTIADVPDDRLRKTADRALENLDGRVKLMLCAQCDTNFKRFCGRVFDQEVRVPYTDGLEKMMVAWLAFVVRCACRKLIVSFREAGYAHHTVPCRDQNNRFDASGRNGAANPKGNGRSKEHDCEIPAASGRGGDFVSLREAGSSPGLVLGTVQKITPETGVHAALARTS